MTNDHHSGDEAELRLTRNGRDVSTSVRLCKSMVMFLARGDAEICADINAVITILPNMNFDINFDFMHAYHLAQSNFSPAAIFGPGIAYFVGTGQ